MSSGRLDLKKQSYDFMLKNRAAALATADNKGIPHVVIVYCIVKEDFSLYFSTRVESRKYTNLIDNPVASMAFYDEKSLDTIQLTGSVERINDLKKEQDILYQLLTLRYREPNWPVPPVKLFERGATNELAIMKLTPTEMTYANFETTEDGRYKPFFQKVI